MCSENKNTKWIVLIGASLLTLSTVGIINNCFSIYIIPICEDLGFSRSQYTLTQTISFAAAMLGSALSWKIYRRFDMMKCLKTCSIVVAVVYFSYSFASHLFGFYLRAVFVGLCISLVGNVPVMILVRKWFSDNYASALGLAYLGSGLGGAAFNKIADILLINCGWRSTYRILGMVMAVLVVTAAFGLVRDRKEERSESVSAAKTAQGRIVSPSDTAIMLTCTVIAVCASGCLMYITTPFYQDIGYSESFAANCASATFILLCIGKIVQGRIIDKKGLLSSFCFAHIGFVFAFAALCFFKKPLYVIPVLCGGLFANPYSTVIAPVIPNYVYRSEDRAKAVGWYLAACNGGLAISPTVSSVVYDLTGSYVPLFAAMIVLCVITLFVFARMMNKE